MPSLGNRSRLHRTKPAASSVTLIRSTHRTELSLADQRKTGYGTSQDCENKSPTGNASRCNGESRATSPDQVRHMMAR